MRNRSLEILPRLPKEKTQKKTHLFLSFYPTYGLNMKISYQEDKQERVLILQIRPLKKMVFQKEGDSED